MGKIWPTGASIMSMQILNIIGRLGGRILCIECESSFSDTALSHSAPFHSNSALHGDFALYFGNIRGNWPLKRDVIRNECVQKNVSLCTWQPLARRYSPFVTQLTEPLKYRQGYLIIYMSWHLSIDLYCIL